MNFLKGKKQDPVKIVSVSSSLGERDNKKSSSLFKSTSASSSSHIGSSNSTKISFLEQEKQMLKLTLDHVLKENTQLKNQIEDMKMTVQHNKLQLKEYVENITNKDKVVEKMNNTIEQLQQRLAMYESFQKKSNNYLTSINNLNDSQTLGLGTKNLNNSNCLNYNFTENNERKQEPADLNFNSPNNNENPVKVKGGNFTSSINHYRNMSQSMNYNSIVGGGGGGGVDATSTSNINSFLVSNTKSHFASNSNNYNINSRNMNDSGLLQQASANNYTNNFNQSLHNAHNTTSQTNFQAFNQQKTKKPAYHTRHNKSVNLNLSGVQNNLNTNTGELKQKINEYNVTGNLPSNNQNTGQSNPNESLTNNNNRENDLAVQNQGKLVYSNTQQDFQSKNSIKINGLNKIKNALNFNDRAKYISNINQLATNKNHLNSSMNNSNLGISNNTTNNNTNNNHINTMNSSFNANLNNEHTQSKISKTSEKNLNFNQNINISLENEGATRKIKEAMLNQNKILEEILNIKNDVQFLLESSKFSKEKISKKLNSSFYSGLAGNNNMENSIMNQTMNINISPNALTRFNNPTTTKKKISINNLNNLSINHSRNEGNSILSPNTSFQGIRLTKKTFNSVNYNQPNSTNNSVLNTQQSQNSIIYNPHNQLNTTINNNPNSSFMQEKKGDRSFVSMNNTNMNISFCNSKVDYNKLMISNVYNIQKKTGSKNTEKFQNFLSNFDINKNILILLDGEGVCWEIIKRPDITPEKINSGETIVSILNKEYENFLFTDKVINLDFNNTNYYEDDLLQSSALEISRINDSVIG